MSAPDSAPLTDFSGLLDALGHLPEGFVAIDAQQLIVEISAGAQRMFGYSAAEAVGQPLEILLPPGACARHRGHVEQFVRSHREARPMSSAAGLKGRRKSGEEFAVDIAISSFRPARGEAPLMLAIVRELHAEVELRPSSFARTGAWDDSLLALLQDWGWEEDALLRVTALGPNFSAQTGLPRRVLLGTRLLDHLAAEADGGDALRLLDTTSLRAAYRDVVLAVQLAGQTRWWSLSANPVIDESGQFTGYRGVTRDVTATVSKQRDLIAKPARDELTGLPNKRLLSERVAALANAAEPAGFALLLVDLDGFAHVNESAGNAAGDAVLCEFARRLVVATRASDVVGRLTGDEFVVIVDKVATHDDVKAVGSKLIDSAAKTFGVAEHQFKLGASIGYCFAPLQGQDWETLLGNARLALTQAKGSGGNALRGFDQRLAEQASRSGDLRSALQQALPRQELVLHYQPLFNAATGRLSSCEALLRWYPEGKSVSPANFIPIAEESRLILEIDEWVLATACAQAKAWASTRPLPIAINLSARHFRARSAPAMVERVLLASGIDPALLTIEITETAAIEQADDALADLLSLRELGVRIALDDFGTGYSSLIYLHRFPIDCIKIDREFTRDLTTNCANVSIARAVTLLSHELGKTVVAEGVETQEQLELLRGLGVDIIQGYLLGKPMPAEELTALLSAQD